MNLETLADTAAAAAVKELAATTAKGSMDASKAVWTWIRSKAGADQTPTLDRIEAAPERASSPIAAQGIVMALLEDRLELAEELERLLRGAGHTTLARQDATAGDNAQIAQVAGRSNSVNQTQ